jgi:hypothetical protein
MFCAVTAAVVAEPVLHTVQAITSGAVDLTKGSIQTSVDLA